MKRKKRRPDFEQSEPEFLISCLDRHPDWAVVVCLVGGGQEINTGEAGIGEWLSALDRVVSGWRIYVSDRLVDSEYGAGQVVEALRGRDARTVRAGPSPGHVDALVSERERLEAGQGTARP